MKVRLCDAGAREKSIAADIVKRGALPVGVTLEDAFSRGTYDSDKDRISLTVKGCSMTFDLWSCGVCLKSGTRPGKCACGQRF